MKNLGLGQKFPFPGFWALIVNYFKGIFWRELLEGLSFLKRKLSIPILPLAFLARPFFRETLGVRENFLTPILLFLL